ncbi:MAG: 50S ribosomal protein L5 [Gemmatimonadota bacterium]|nr:50S ribosomal protein L5 [Gemmatimonadota bacterium]
MATKEKQAKSGKKGGGREAKARVAHAGAGLPVPPPRLRIYYRDTVRPKLMAQFGFTNPHQVPTLTKIVLNVGLGEAIKQPKALDVVVEELATITGQQPVRKRAKKSIANFGLRQGQEIGAAVTLRGARMWEFLDRFISVSIPRIRDFRGLNTRSFDGRGNYSVGLKEQVIFPEINYDQVDKARGLEVSIITTARTDQEARRLLELLGMPFQREGENIPVIKPPPTRRRR